MSNDTKTEAALLALEALRDESRSNVDREWVALAIARLRAAPPAAEPDYDPAASKDHGEAREAAERDRDSELLWWKTEAARCLSKEETLQRKVDEYRARVQRVREALEY